MGLEHRFRQRTFTVAVVSVAAGWSALVAPASAQTPAPPPPVASRPADAAVPTPLADRVPAGAVFYAAWAGTDNLPVGWGDSHLATLLTAIDLPGWWRDTLPDLLPQEARGHPVVAQLLELGQVVAGYAWTNPSAIYSLGPGVSENLTPETHMCFLIRFPNAKAAEAAEQDLNDRLSAILQGNPIPNVRMYRKDDTLALTTNDPSNDSPLDPLLKPLSATERYQLAVKQSAAGGDRGPITLYLDLEKAWALSDEKNEGNPEYDRNMRVAGLRHAKAVMLSSGTDGKDFVTRGYVELTPERTGLLGFLTSPKPVDGRLYGGVPRAAVSMTSMSLDLADLLKRATTEAEAFKAGLGEQATAWVGLLGGIVNLDVPAFADNVGTEAALYSLSAGGSYEYIVLMRPKDPVKADQQLLGLAEGLKRLGLTVRPDLPKVILDRAEANGITLTTADNGILSPSWAVKNGYLLIAPSRSALSAALAEMDKGVLTDSPDFTRLRSKLAAPAGASLGYSDLARSLPTMYANWQFTAGLARRGIPPQLKQLPIPTFETLKPETDPAISAAWVDDAGLHYRTVSPYPAAEMFSATYALAVGSDAVVLKLPRISAALKSPAPAPRPPQPPRTRPNPPPKP